MSYRDAHRVARKLWVGAAPFDQAGLEHFDVIVLCARELQWIPTPGDTIHAPLDDDGGPLSNREIDLALHAAKAVELFTQQNKRVLVTCHEGVNRSSFVAALVLMRRGSTADGAITQIRSRRAPASGKTPFSNPHFAKQLRQIRRVPAGPAHQYPAPRSTPPG